MVATNTPGVTDTNVLIDFSRNLPSAVAFMATQKAIAAVQISIVSAMELVFGCLNKAEMRTLQKFRLSLTILAISEMASQHALQLMESYTLSHSLSVPDAIIAATALEHNLPLYTLNARPFQMIPGPNGHPSLLPAVFRNTITCCHGSTAIVFSHFSGCGAISFRTCFSVIL